MFDEEVVKFEVCHDCSDHERHEVVRAIISFNFLLMEFAISPPFLRNPPKIELTYFFLHVASDKMSRVTCSGESFPDCTDLLGVNPLILPSAALIVGDFEGNFALLI